MQSRVIRRSLSKSNIYVAKHLDQIKGGRFAVEVLVRGKDAEENEKLFVKLTEKIKEAGVSHLLQEA